MDGIFSRDKAFSFDLERGELIDKTEDEPSVHINSVNPTVADDLKSLTPERCEGDANEPLGIPDKKESATKEKRKKKTNNKKPPRPPRPPSLDFADEKLIKEITELALLKRARMERMRALKKVKNSKASSSSSLYSVNAVIALVFTVLFFLVIIFQGLSPKTDSPLASPETAGGFISVQYDNPSSSPNFVDPPSDASHSLVEKVAGSDAHEG